MRALKVELQVYLLEQDLGVMVFMLWMDLKDRLMETHTSQDW